MPARVCQESVKTFVSATSHILSPQLCHPGPFRYTVKVVQFPHVATHTVCDQTLRPDIAVTSRDPPVTVAVPNTVAAPLRKSVTVDPFTVPVPLIVGLNVKNIVPVTGVVMVILPELGVTKKSLAPQM